MRAPTVLLQLQSPESPSLPFRPPLSVYAPAHTNCAPFPRPVCFKPPSLSPETAEKRTAQSNPPWKAYRIHTQGLLPAPVHDRYAPERNPPALHTVFQSVVRLIKSKIKLSCLHIRKITSFSRRTPDSSNMYSPAVPVPLLHPG